MLSESAADVTIQEGKLLDRQEIAASIRNLYRTGDYADIRAVTMPVDGGVRVDFVVRQQLFFNRVLISGLVAPPTEASAIAAVQLPLGEPYQSLAVDEGLQRLRDVLHEEGQYLSEVSAETIPHPETQQIDVIVNVKAGPRARVRGIQLKNGTEYRDSELLSRLKMKAGSSITSARIQRGTDRIRKFLVKKSHLNARASVHRGGYDPKTNTIPLELEVTEGPRVQVTVTGARFSSGDLRKLVPVYQEGAVDPDLLEEGKRNIRERLERQGYFDAAVDYEMKTQEVQLSNGRKGTEEVIAYKVERGDRLKLLGIEIRGNRYFGEELLRSRLQVFGQGFATRGRFSRRLLDADRDSMRNLYLANGFLQASVSWRPIPTNKGTFRVRFEIDEGKQTRVAALQIEGNHALTTDELLGIIAATPGQPYSEFNVETDRDNILARYYNEGFPDVRFTAKAEPVDVKANAISARNGDGSTPEKQPANKGNANQASSSEFQGDLVRVVYQIEEGLQRRVKNVLLTGYAHTRPGVIRREVRVKPQEPLREGEVVESQRRLYNLGTFNRVTIEPQNPNGTDPNKNVVVLVEEAKRYTLAYGGGFEVQRLASTSNPAGSEVQAAVRGILEVSKLNLTGRGDSLSLKLRGSTIEDRALLGYTHPNTFSNPHLSLQATAYTEKTQDINTFTQTRYESSMQLNEQVTSRTTLLYHYAFRKVLVTNVNATLSPAEIPLFNSPTLVSQFGGTWVRDARDNPADATKGNFNSADLSVADTSIGSSSSFLRFLFQNSTYHPIGRRFSFARSVRFGILEPYHDTSSLAFTAPAPGACNAMPPLLAFEPQLIPLPERFFAGGGTSLRGFALNQAGPRDPCTGFPVGGQALLILNQEFRFPMRLPYIGTALSGALFYDGGNVYSRLGRITFRTYSPEPVFSSSNSTQCQNNCTNELNYFAHTVGMGFRYSTPVGPIRIDLGYQLNRPRFVSPICPNNQVSASCLQQPVNFQATRLPGFQIFFNLGSTF